LKKISIAIIFSGDNFGGSSISTLSLIEKLDFHFKCEILVYNEGELTRLLNLRKIKFCYLPRSVKPVKGKLFQKFKIILNSYLNYKYFRKNKYQIIYTNEIDMHLACFLPVFLSKKKHVWHQRTPSKRAVLLSYFSNLVTVSEFTKNSFPFIIKSRAKVIYNPFDIFIGSKKEISKNPRIGFIGNLIKRKNINVFIQILSKLNDNFSGLVFGEKREPEFTIANNLISQLDINNKIDFLGLVFPIEQYLNEVDILIAPATDEAFGRNLVEAMMLGIPVLAYDFGGHKEIIESGVDGFLIKDNNVNDYITHIDLLTTDKELYNKISINAHLKAKSKFGVDQHVKQMVEFYNKILN
jgi:glycosyltransferase involved in cell wall biosynthesis